MAGELRPTATATSTVVVKGHRRSHMSRHYISMHILSTLVGAMAASWLCRLGRLENMQGLENLVNLDGRQVSVRSTFQVSAVEARTVGG